MSSNGVPLSDEKRQALGDDADRYLSAQQSAVALAADLRARRLKDLGDRDPEESSLADVHVGIGDAVTLNQGSYSGMKGKVVEVGEGGSGITISVDLFGKKKLVNVGPDDVVKAGTNVKSGTKQSWDLRTNRPVVKASEAPKSGDEAADPEQAI